MFRIHDAARIEDLQMIGSWLCVSDRRELAVTRDPEDWATLAYDAWKSPIKKIAYDEMIPVFAFGANPVSGDMANVWGFKTDRGCEAVRAVTKYILRIMIPELRAMGIRHAVCLVHPSNAASRKWLTHLGFQLRATLKGFGSRGEEMLLFQRDEPDASDLL